MGIDHPAYRIGPVKKGALGVPIGRAEEGAQVGVAVIPANHVKPISVGRVSPVPNFWLHLHPHGRVPEFQALERALDQDHRIALRIHLEGAAKQQSADFERTGAHVQANRFQAGRGDVEPDSAHPVAQDLEQAAAVQTQLGQRLRPDVGLDFLPLAQDCS